MDMKAFKWIREPKEYKIEHLQNDNAPVLQIETEEKYFSFVVKTDFQESHH